MWASKVTCMSVRGQAARRHCMRSTRHANGSPTRGVAHARDHRSRTTWHDEPVAHDPVTSSHAFGPPDSKRLDATVLDATVLDALRDIVGTAHVLRADDLTERHRIDWTRRFATPNAVVVRPGTVADVAAIVQLCRRFHVAMVPQGGNTGLVGGSVPLDGELVVSTERLTDTSDVTPGGEITVGAGVTLEEVQRRAKDAGWEYLVDIASRSSATIGGTIATNAGGLRVVRHGDTRSHVRGVQFVAGTGAVIDAMPAALRDNTGYHLPSLLCGSEGTLGIITAARLRLGPPSHDVATAMLGFATVHDAAVAAESLRRSVPPVAAIEFFLRAGLALVCEAFDWPDPLPGPAAAYLLVDVASPHATDDIVEVVRNVAGLQTSAIGLDGPTRGRLWRYRERHTEAIATRGIPHKLDIAVPPGALGAFLADVSATVVRHAPDAQLWLFGHAGEGSVHVNITNVDPADAGIDDAVMELVLAHHGSISAEHGIGRAKLPWLQHAKSAAQLALMRDLKAALDPDHLMNPAVLVPRRQP